jgi:hypothetical protein
MAGPVRWLSPKPTTGRVIIAVAATAFTSVFFIDFCNLVYQCGCRSLWAGADAACNIHTHGVRHCPWCSVGPAGAFLVWAIIVGSQTSVALRSRFSRLYLIGLASFAVFPVIGGVLAAGLGLWFGYWG